MGVLSKALRVPVMVGVVLATGGCSIGRPGATSDSGDALASAGSPRGVTEGEAASEQNSTAQISADEHVASLLNGSADGVASGTANTGAPTAGATSMQFSSLLDRDKSGVGLIASAAPSNGSQLFVIQTSSTEPAYDVQLLDNPRRLVVDVLGESVATKKEIALQSNPYISRVRLGSHKDKARIVFDYLPAASANASDYRVEQANGSLVVAFAGPGATIPQATDIVAQATGTTSTTTVASAIGEAPETDVAARSIEPVEQLSTDSSAPAELARDEVATEQTNAPSLPVEDLRAAPARAATQTAAAAELNALRFEKTNDDSGQIVIGLDGEAPFDLRRTAPSEYVLTVPGVTPKDATTYPQITPKGFPGIRSVRAVPQGNATLVRMFIDPGVELYATPGDKQITVKAKAPSAVAANKGAADTRAQLEVADQPQGQAAAQPAGAAAGTNLLAADGSKVYTGRLISLDLQDTDIDNALRIIAEVSNLNIIASDDVAGKVTLRLIDVPWDQALDVILKTNGLDQVQEGNVIRIAPVDKLRQEREALKELKVAKEQLEDLTVNYVRVSYARAADIKEQVESVLSERGSVAVDERTNQLIVKDIVKGHKEAEHLIKQLDLRTPQVLLETQIVEGQRNILRDLGFQWNFSYSASPETGNATGLNFPNSVVVGGSTAGNNQAIDFPAVLGDSGSAITAVLDSADGSRLLSLRLSALETEGKVKVISRPQVATVNNKQAQIKSVETVRVRLPDSGTAIGIGAGASSQGGGSTAFEEIDVGIELRVTPQASPDYYVLLDIEAKSSTFGGREVDGIPSTIDREATSTILVKSGQTFALGGVYRIQDNDTIEGVPFMKDIPFFGALFRRTFLNKTDEELIFFITPHIVEGSFDEGLMQKPAAS